MGDAPIVDADGWVTPHSRRSDSSARSRNPGSKRAYEGQAGAAAASEAAAEASPRAPVERRRVRPVARYRRSVAGPEIAGSSSGSNELEVGASYERPIELLSPVAATPAPRVRPSLEVINLDDDSPPSLRWVAPTLNAHQAGTSSSSSRRSESGEPSTKRVCNVADESRVAPVEAPVVLPGSGRSGRSSGSRSVRRERREQQQQQQQQAARLGALNPVELADAAHGEHVDSGHNINYDERFVRRLQQHEFGAEVVDAQLARSLQEEENRRLIRTPLGVAIDPARFQMFYMRHLERARSNYGQGRGQQPSGLDMLRQFGRRYRAGVADIQERLNVLGALLQGQVPLAMQLAYVDRDFNENDYEMLLALDDTVKQVGAPQSRIDELPIIEATSETGDCCICLEKAEVGEKIRRLPCLHGFHQQCIDNWLQRRANCPVCKADV